MPGIRPLSSIEIALMARELSGALQHAYFKSFYDLGSENFLITFSRERRELAAFVSPGRSIHLTEFREGKKGVTQFAAAVRKALDACRLRDVLQHGEDRILVLEFEGRRSIIMVLEMFGKGNIVLVDDKGLVELAYRSVSFSDRSLRKGMLYSFPAQRGRTGAYQDAAKALEHPEPALYQKSGKLLDFTIEALEKYEHDRDANKVRFETLSKLLDNVYLAERSSGRDEAKIREAEELRKSVGKLREQIRENEKEAAEYRNAANAIFGKMNELNLLLAEAKKLRPKDAKELGGAGSIRVKSVDAKKKSVRVEL